MHLITVTCNRNHTDGGKQTPVVEAELLHFCSVTPEIGRRSAQQASRRPEGERREASCHKLGPRAAAATT